MSFTIGRASLPVDPTSASWLGNTLTITGWISPTTTNDTNHAYAIRQQLLGLVDNDDESVFPCTFSVDPNWDGFYSVLSVQVEGRPHLMETQGRMPYTLVLQRVTGGFGKPAFESITQSVVRTNSHAVTTPQGVVASAYFPSVYGFYESDTSTLPSASGGVANLTTEDGTMNVTYLQAPIAASTYRWFVKPADYFKGSARVEVKYGSTWYPIHGKQIPSASAGDWRISNGYTRLYPSQVSGNGRFTVETYRAGSWVGREFTLGVYDPVGFTWGALPMTGDSTGNLATPRVLRNDPSCVTVQCSIVSQKYTISLRRAETFVTVALTLPAASGLLYGFATSAVVASTAFTGGIRATASDANGLRYLISTPVARTNDLVNGRIYTTAAANSSQFQITPDYLVGVVSSDTNVRDLFLAAGNELHRVVLG